MHQIILDTNTVFSALRSKQGASYRLLSLLGTGKFEINLSVPLVIEYEDVLKRNNSSLQFKTTELNQFLDFVCSVGNLHNVFFLWRPFLKDPKDDMILELAVRSNSQYIVTYNKHDFSGVEKFGIQLVTAKEFLQIIKEIP
ncbi:putative toxin-antitoxin system toxin component, PIN family [bacterium]|nr:MAG: putative toxin-antitoxin system toxin component, PIN family [bacterium]